MDFIKISNATVYISYESSVHFDGLFGGDVEAGCEVGWVGRELLRGLGLDFAEVRLFPLTVL